MEHKILRPRAPSLVTTSTSMRRQQSGVLQVRRRRHPRWLPRRDRHGQDQRARTRRHRLRPALPPCPGGIDPSTRRATCTPRAPRCGNLRSLAGKNGRVTVSAAQRDGSCSHCSEACTSRSGLVVRDRIELSTFRVSGRNTSRRVRLWPESSLADVRRLWTRCGPSRIACRTLRSWHRHEPTASGAVGQADLDHKARKRASPRALVLSAGQAASESSKDLRGGDPSSARLACDAGQCESL